MSDQAKNGDRQAVLDGMSERLQHQWGAKGIHFATFRGELTVELPRELLVEVMRFLRLTPEYEFASLVDVCAVDHIETPEKRFEVHYVLRSFKQNVDVRVRTWAPADDPHVPSVTPIWPGANWHERETWDLYGVVFDGHPDLRRILTRPDFEGHPNRKDFPLRPNITDRGWRPLPSHKYEKPALEANLEAERRERGAAEGLRFKRKK